MLPSAAAVLGVPGPDLLGFASLAREPRAVVVVLVDGMGLNLLVDRAGHAPYLRSLLAAGHDGVPAELTAGFPTTTASSLATLGTGSAPGRHGVMGYDVLDTASDRVVNQLTWPADLDPVAWQPYPTVFERAVEAGVDVVHIGPRAFAASGLTQAALRGGRYVAAASLQARTSAALSEASRSRRLLAYLYWEGLDRTGHDQGCGSLAWTAQLEDADAALAGLAAGLPADTLLVITADHGMTDIAMSARIDLAHRPDLRSDVRLSAGEPRAVYLWPRPGRREHVIERWRTELGDDFDVVTRDEVVAAGWFGPAPRPEYLARAGEVIALARGRRMVVDSARQRRDAKVLIGWHGALTPDEAIVPLLLDAR